jgi:hypothetical protein
MEEGFFDTDERRYRKPLMRAWPWPTGEFKKAASAFIPSYLRSSASKKSSFTRCQTHLQSRALLFKLEQHEWPSINRFCCIAGHPAR